jgi:hypothetical protein
MDKLTRLTTEQRANLTAYLDGELDDDDAQQIEQVLSQSEVARREVAGLSRTWDLLDHLPRTRASEQFSTNTIASVQLEAARSAPHRLPAAPATRRGTVWGLWMIGLLACLCLGYLSTSRGLPSDIDLLLDDLPIIQSFDQYHDAGSVEFLQELQRHKTFSPSEQDSSPPEQDDDNANP